MTWLLWSKEEEEEENLCKGTIDNGQSKKPPMCLQFLERRRMVVFDGIRSGV